MNVLSKGAHKKATFTEEIKKLLNGSQVVSIGTEKQIPLNYYSRQCWLQLKGSSKVEATSWRACGSLCCSGIFRNAQKNKDIGYRKIFHQDGRRRTIIPGNLRKIFFSNSWKKSVFLSRSTKRTSLYRSTQPTHKERWAVPLQDKRNQKSWIKYTAVLFAP